MARLSERKVLLYLFAGLILAEMVWIGFAALVAPGIIRRAYAGESIALFNGVIAPDTPFAVSHYLSLWTGFARSVAFTMGAFGAVVAPVWFFVPAVRDRIASLPGITRARSVLLSSATAVAILVGVAILLLVWPVQYLKFITEDGIAENVTFAALAVAAVLFTRLQFGQTGSRRIGTALLAVGCALMALEEISWGQRLFGIGTPEFLRLYSRSGTTNLHNLFPMNAGKYVTVGVILILGLTLWPWLLRRSQWVAGQAERFGIPRVPAPVVPFFVLAAVFFLVVHFAMFPRGDELAELGLALGLAAMALTLSGGDGISIAPSRGPGSVAVLGTVLALGLTHICLVNAKAPLYTRFLQIGAERLLSQVGYEQQALEVFEYLEAGEGTWTQATLLSHGKLLADMGRQAEAATVLERAVADSRTRMEASPRNAALYQSLAEALWMLDLEDEAREAVATALALDDERLTHETDENSRARLYFSRARSLAIVGATDLSVVEIASACPLARRAETKIALAVWTSSNIQGSMMPEECGFLQEVSRDDHRRKL